MAKRPSMLAAALNETGAAKQGKVVPFNTAASGEKETGLLGGHYPKPMIKQFRILGVELGRDNRDLLAEGINMVFAKYGKPEIAPSTVRNDL